MKYYHYKTFEIIIIHLLIQPIIAESGSFDSNDPVLS